MESKKSIGDKLRAPQLERINFEKCEIASTSMEKVAAAADNLHNLVSENVQVNTRFVYNYHLFGILSVALTYQSVLPF